MIKTPLYLIVNPASAYGRTRERWPAIQEALRTHGLEYIAAFTEQRGHAIDLARQAAAQGYSLIVAVGGEGTVNEVVNGLVDQSGRFPANVSLGILPSGTGTDFVRSLDIPRDPIAAVRHLKGAVVRTVDLGYLECAPPSGEGPAVQRYFVNVAGLGFDGEVAERVEHSSKAIGGTIPYLMNLFACLLAYQNKDVEIRYNGQTVTGRANSVIAANGRYFGGGMFIAPNASLDDGLLDWLLLGDLSKVEVVVNLPRLYKGTHIYHPKVRVYRAREIQVTARERMLIQADGELVGQAPVTFRVIPKALRVVGAAHAR